MQLLARVGLVAAPALSMLALAAPAGAAGYACDASALQLASLAGSALEPITVGGGADSCPDLTRRLSGAAAKLPPGVGAGTLTASTSLSGAHGRIAAQRALAVGGVTGLKVLSLPTLPLQLPAIALPDRLRAVQVDLTPLKTALDQAGGNLTKLLGPVVDLAGQAAGTVTGTTGGTVGSTTGATGTIVDGVTGTVGQTTGTVTSTVGGLLRSRTRAVTDLIPDTITLDVTQAVVRLLPSATLPAAELVSARGALAYAGGLCGSSRGAPILDGASQVGGLQVLGHDVPAGQAVDRTVTLIDTGTIDPSSADLSKIALPASLTGLGLDLSNTPLLRDAVQAALDALGNVKVLDPTLARIRITPPSKTRSAGAITQRGPGVEVTIAGQRLVDTTLGLATVRASGIDCSTAQVSTTTASGALLECTKRRIVLVDVIERSRRVKLLGVADPRYSGRTVAIAFGPGGHVVAHAKVRKDGSFSTTAPLPSRRVRGTNAARYQARIGHQHSLALKLRRRMAWRSIASRRGKVTIRGRVSGPLAAPARTITLRRRVSCQRTEVVRRFKPHRDGTFSITVAAPQGAQAVVYRLTTRVRRTRRNSKTFPTFTLPRAIEL